LNGKTHFFNQTVEGEPRDAASVVLLRDAVAGGLEVFMLRRGGSSTVMNDAYVFPGGKVDPEDAAAERLAELGLAGLAAQLLGEPDLDAPLAASLFVAACRETFEETGVQVQARDLIPLSRWITPKVPAMMRKRFDTRFFLACLPSGATATHDGQEADASAWYSPREALERYRDREIMLAPPQIMTLAGLVSSKNFAQLREHLREHSPRLIEPLSVQSGKQRVMVYPGDERHPVRERAMPGPTALVFRDDRFEPESGFEQFFIG
jgi:8-oxo-dGTP pyrophosphatase MutT (NUDIX family)